MNNKNNNFDKFKNNIEHPNESGVSTQEVKNNMNEMIEKSHVQKNIFNFKQNLPSITNNDIQVKNVKVNLQTSIKEFASKRTQIDLKVIGNRFNQKQKIKISSKDNLVINQSQLRGDIAPISKSQLLNQPKINKEISLPKINKISEHATKNLKIIGKKNDLTNHSSSQISLDKGVKKGNVNLSSLYPKTPRKPYISVKPRFDLKGLEQNKPFNHISQGVGIKKSEFNLVKNDSKVSIKKSEGSNYIDRPFTAMKGGSKLLFGKNKLSNKLADILSSKETNKTVNKFTDELANEASTKKDYKVFNQR
jgi:hypothetical protein